MSGLFGVLSVAADGREPDAMWTYKRAAGGDLQMAVFLPADYQAAKSFPTFVVFHGGSWRTGEASWHYPDCVYWSSRGMIAASVDYRLKDRDNVEVPLECVKDAKSAIRFLRKNAERLKVDPDRIVAAGGSAGGQMAAALATITSPDTNDDSYDPAISCRPAAVILYNPYFKCPAPLSPPEHVAAGLPPCITFLGDQDPAIPVKGVRAFHEALQKAGNVSEFYVGKGGRHGFCNGRNPRNKFFYWSLELQDRFLVKQGILSGPSKVQIPPGVAAVGEGDYDAYQ
ncbi:MAG: alpha/beta hydrolase fold domain-containing protein [Planctomycetales bacterium]|nr:alpha/beta hydrolase fold domain-containing protein [Planctomycetales bacterium]NIM08003.1 alpha/beta hydrolase fold domain-containing protein [Planctomycetales bacterium]NIN76590.1 alpha/beta hydrolase fold domain-containing protein [Planctomycetales bacterium]NIO33780.1 alpha/beta hydrolase fold domain-containing protein [Planctomycetales bacterium]NIP68187.1 alpha/beta hydrolase fold domain-containing protein [Planctomycetales bacterium]